MEKLCAACKAKLYWLIILNEEDKAVVGVKKKNRLKVFLMPSIQLDIAVVVQEQLQSLVAVKVDSFVGIDTFPCGLLAVQKK